MGSLLWSARDALVGLLTDSTTAEGVREMSNGARVYDGPRPKDEGPKKFVVVGIPSLIEDGTPGLRSAQAPSPMHGAWREETGEIDIVAAVWSGDRDLPTIRTECEELVDACEQRINADRTLNGVLTLTSNLAEVIAVEIREARTDKGPFVEATLTVGFTALLTS